MRQYIVQIKTTDIGPLFSATLFHNGANASSGWKLDWMKVTIGPGQGGTGTWIARFNGWMNDESKTLPLESIKGSCDWMSTIPDTTYLHEMNIPGTHDSGTFNGSGNDQCQETTIEQQLQMGNRFLDIRLRCYINPDYKPGTHPASQKEAFTVYHGDNWQKLYFDSASWIHIRIIPA